MPKVERAAPCPGDHQEAVALLEEIGRCLKLPMEYLRGLAEDVTDQPWEQLDTRGAEAVVELLAEALHRTLASASLAKR